MQLAAPGYDIVIGNSNASIFDVNLSAGRLEDQIDTQVVAAVIDGSPVTLGQLFTSDFKQSADRSEFVIPETREETIDTNVNRSEDFSQQPFSRGGTSREGVTVQLGDGRTAFIRDDVSQSISDTQRIAEQTQYDADGPIPKTRLNLEMDPNKDIYKFFGKTTRPARANTKPLYPVGTLGSVVTDILTTVHRTIRPKKSVFVLGVIRKA